MEPPRAVRKASRIPNWFVIFEFSVRSWLPRPESCTIQKDASQGGFPKGIDMRKPLLPLPGDDHLLGFCDRPPVDWPRPEPTQTGQRVKPRSPFQHPNF